MLTFQNHCILFFKFIALCFYFLTMTVIARCQPNTVAMLGSYGDENKRCDDLNRTSYLRSESMRIMEIPKTMVKAVSLNQCAKHCSMKYSGVDCVSFEYNAASQSCSLLTSQGQPFGPAIVVQTNERGIAFFEQVCIASEELCTAPYAFERFPQHVLMGQASHTISADGLSDCLSLCLEAKRRFSVDCRSLMFYYETGECILNQKTKTELPMSFTNDTKFHLVDYFDNNCFDIICYGHSDVHWISTEDYNIGVNKDVIMHGLSADECRKTCLNNMVGVEVFPCKAYVYSSTQQECHLTAESGFTRKIVINSSLSTDDSQIPKLQLQQELSSFTAGQYVEKFCIDSSAPACKDISFELIPDRMLDSFDIVFETKSVAHCLKECLIARQNCTSAMYFYEKNECVLNKRSQFSNPDLFIPMQNVDYYNNVCEYESQFSEHPTLLPTPAKNALSLDDTTFMTTGPGEIEQALMNFQAEKMISINEKNNVFRDPVEKVKGTLETECRLDGIFVSAIFEMPTTGALFIKDHSATCRQIFTNATESRLEIPYPSPGDSNPECPGVELAPNLWSFIIVIQKNDLGIPSLMTEADRVFNVTCDYTNTAVSQTNNEKNPSELFVTSKVSDEYIGKIKMSIWRHDKSVTTVALGEELELRWIVQNYNSNNNESRNVGYFIDECIAERLGGEPPDPSPLRLIEHGCPDRRVVNKLILYPVGVRDYGFSTTIKAFRFDGSRRVRIRCAINICVDQCEPVNCDQDHTGSFGKRKKRQTVADLQTLLRRYHEARMSGTLDSSDEQDSQSDGSSDSEPVIEHSTISGTYTIIDSPDENVLANSELASRVSLEGESKRQKSDEPHPSDDAAAKISKFTNQLVPENNASVPDCTVLTAEYKDKVCIIRPIFTSLLVGLGVLLTIQLFIFINCIYNKCSSDHTGLLDEDSSVTSYSSLSMKRSPNFCYPESYEKNSFNYDSQASIAKPDGCVFDYHNSFPRERKLSCSVLPVNSRHEKIHDLRNFQRGSTRASVSVVHYKI